ncbi:MAG: YraN family protein [Hyphomicrobiaceae bacterium]|nr:YraN family protein [Hyphomicrobiaceae bacterium]
MTEAAPAGSAARRRRYHRGYRAEWIAAAFLTLKGFRVIGRRVQTPLGEIDLIAVRGSRIAFVEVKARGDRAEAEAALRPSQGRRMRLAAEYWLGHRPRYRAHERGFDAVLVLRGIWPCHLKNRM